MKTYICYPIAFLAGFAISAIIDHIKRNKPVPAYALVILIFCAVLGISIFLK